VYPDLCIDIKTPSGKANDSLKPWRKCQMEVYMALVPESPALKNILEYDK
jgi:hypothetical protein